MKPRPSSATLRLHQNAFSLSELLVVIAFLAILAGMLLPALSKAKAEGQDARCLGNIKALGLCFVMYADDNKDSVVGAGNWVSGSMSGLEVTPSMSDPAALRSARLWKYNESAGIYQDPTEQPWPFWTPTKVKRIRSYSLNSSWAGASIQSQVPQYIYAPFAKLSQVKFPGPSMNLTFIDEQESSIDDGQFAIEVPDARFARWRNEPSSRHGGGAALGFADGHSELWKWTQPYLLDGSQFRPNVPGNITIGSLGAVMGDPPGSGSGFPVYYPPLQYKDPDLIKVSKVILDKKGWDAAEGRAPQSIYAF